MGYVDPLKDSILVQLELKGLPSVVEVKKSKRGKKSGLGLAQNKIVEVELAQDKTALRTRKGDTGSVLWMARCVVYMRLHKARLTLFP